MRRPALVAAVALALGFTAVTDALGEQGAGGLPGALERAGWAARYLPDGTLELQRARPEVPAGEEAAAPTAPGAAPAQENWERLRESGWRVDRTADGSVVLYPPPLAEAETDPDPAAGAVPRRDAAWERLRESGWGVERAADGSALLFPPPSRGAPGPARVDPSDARAGGQAAAPPRAAADLSGLAGQLEARGWRVERGADGSLLLYPQGLVPAAPARSLPRTCAGEVPAVVREGGIELPVDSLEEARRIAESWLAGVEGPAALVGSIQEVNRVFLVSILAAAEPPVPLHQLVVNGRTGRVIVLF